MAHLRLKFKIKVNPNAVQASIDNLLNDEQTMLEIHNLLRKMCDPYVPFLEGPLSQTVEVEPRCIRYIQPYARYQYYGIYFNHTIDYHPLATALWDKVMLAERGDEFVAEVKKILNRRAKEING